MTVDRWWCVVDFYDDSPEAEYAIVQTGYRDGSGDLHTDPGQWIVDGPGSRDLWERFNELQFSECPFGTA